MNAHRSAAHRKSPVQRADWRAEEFARAAAAPEIRRSAELRTQVPFDRVALSVAAGADEAWALAGSDPALHMLIMQEQTVLQGPNCEVLSGSPSVRVEDVALEGSERWPLLADTRTLPDAPYHCLLVVPLGALRTLPPIGTFCLARDDDLPFTSTEVDRVTGFSALLADVLLERWRTVRDVDRLQGLIQDQRHLAAGMIAALLGIRTQEALATIRARAFSEGRTLADLSSEIVDTLGPQSSSPLT